MIDRRHFAGLAALSAFSALTTGSKATAQTALPPGSRRAGLPPIFDPSGLRPEWRGAEEVLMLAYPGMTALDLVAPQYMFASLLGATVRVVARDPGPIRSDTGLVIVPDLTFDAAPEAPDILFAPGGISGTLAAMEDVATIDFLAARGARAGYVTSVCTGSLLLGQAGLLDGYEATSHWLAMPVLDAFGATPVDARIVQDRNRLTGGGVTAGLDFGLTLVDLLRGEDYAKGVQLLAEYAPEPPFDAGRMETAPPAVATRMTGLFPGFDDHARALAEQRRGG
ncbi:MAG: DJ-1/PfpI family protein [Pseudomonadota bacterium]